MTQTAIGRVPGKAPATRGIPATAIAAGTSVLTADGALPVEFLSPGDRIITRGGMRALREMEITLVQNARVIRVSARALGAGRPSEDVILAAGQPILIRDWRAQALYGQPQAMVPAERLADGEYVRAEVLAEVCLITLRFDSDEVIYAGGLELACTGVTVTA